MSAFPRITRNSDIMGDKTCVQCTRVMVDMIVTQINECKDVSILLEEYPYLSQEDICEGLRYAVWLVDS